MIITIGTKFSWLGVTYVVQEVRLGYANPVLAYAEESIHQIFAFTGEQLNDAKIINKKQIN